MLHEKYGYKYIKIKKKRKIFFERKKVLVYILIILPQVKLLKETNLTSVFYKIPSLIFFTINIIYTYISKEKYFKGLKWLY